MKFVLDRHSWQLTEEYLGSQLYPALTILVHRDRVLHPRERLERLRKLCQGLILSWESPNSKGQA